MDDSLAGCVMRDEEQRTERTEDTASQSALRRLVLRAVLPGETALVPLAGAPRVLGRGTECDLRLEHARVSRRHAELRAQGRLSTIRDLGSTNGTWVNAEKIEHCALAAGAVVRLGDWLGVVDETEGEGEPIGFGEIAPGLWGGSLLASVLAPIRSAGSARLPVLLIGRTGTGKERFARAVHHHGGARGPFHAINCAALPPGLAEGELFGYRKGAFTGASQNYAGQLRAANGGTLFLDEIGDLPLSIQAMLLRALDSGEIAPLGESRPARFDARVVAACHEPLSELVAAGRFREDLAARLGGITLSLPLLRERRADIPSLFRTFLDRSSGGTAPPVSTRLYERLCLYEWPGNVRELELLAGQLLAVRGLEPVLRRSHLPEPVRAAPRPEALGAPRELSRQQQDERDIENFSLALKKALGNVKLAAAASGISRQRAYRLIGSRRLHELLAAARDDSDSTHGRRD